MEMVSIFLFYPMLAETGCSGTISLAWQEEFPTPAQSVADRLLVLRDLLSQLYASELIVPPSVMATTQTPQEQSLEESNWI